ncbi:MAG: zinc ribbon domain-containing protein [Candidatus Thorarchaeota archaeon]
MAWMIPIVAGRRHYRRSSIGATIAGLMIFLIFGIFFFVFFNRSGIFGYGFSFPMIFIILGFVVFVMIIIGISIAASTMSSSYKSQKSNIYRQNQNVDQKQTVHQNPYVAQEYIQKPLETRSKEIPVEDDIPDVKEINFCRYCGAKLDEKAVFCHQCGTKL